MTKICTKCKIIKTISSFTKDKRRGSGLKSWCKDCCSLQYKSYSSNPDKRLKINENKRIWKKGHPDLVRAYNKKWRDENRDLYRKYKREWKRNNKDKARAYELKTKYRLDQDQIDLMLKNQNNLCSICESSSPGRKGWMVDHDHKTGVIRGMLCNTCNWGLGHFKDDEHLLYRAIEYLRKSNVKKAA